MPKAPIQFTNKQPLVLAVLLLAIFVALDAYVTSTKTVWIFNGTSEAYDVVIDGQRSLRLEPNVPQALALGLGNHSLTTTVGGRARLVPFSSGVPALVAAFDIQKVHVVNPDGCGVLLSEQRYFSRDRETEKIALHGRVYYRVDADFVFADFVGAVTKDQQSKIALTLPPTPQAARAVIEAEGGPELVARHQQACARWTLPVADDEAVVAAPLP